MEHLLRSNDGGVDVEVGRHKGSQHNNQTLQHLDIVLSQLKTDHVTQSYEIITAFRQTSSEETKHICCDLRADREEWGPVDCTPLGIEITQAT